VMCHGLRVPLERCDGPEDARNAPILQETSGFAAFRAFNGRVVGGTRFHKLGDRSASALVLRSKDPVADDSVRTSDVSVTVEYARLLSLAVHEFRTPASVVAGYLRMLHRDTSSPLAERQRKIVEEAEKSCARIVELINELSELSKLDGGTAALTEMPVDLFELVEEVAAGVHEAEDRDVHLEVRGEPQGAPVIGDRGRLTGSFSTFFRAVLREQPGSSTVVVDRRRAGERSASRAVIVVAADADVQRAYEASPAALDEKRGGLGLALPIARRVIERHSGRVWTPALDGGETPAARSAIIVSLPLAGRAWEQNR
jgi:signal transduction histidine kinase